MSNEVVMDKSIPFHEPKNEKSQEWEDDGDHLIPQTKHPLSSFLAILERSIVCYAPAIWTEVFSAVFIKSKR